MSATYPMLYSFTATGLDRFQKFMTGDEVSGADFLAPSQELAIPVDDTGPLVVDEFDSARSMAIAICAAFGGSNPQESAGDNGLWAWLTAVLADQLFPLQGGTRKLKEFYRWYPAPPNDWQKAQRHLVRMPVLLYAAFGEDVDHLLHAKPAILPEIREQLTSQQDMFSSNFQRACKHLYWDETKKAPKRGSGSKNIPGTPRRLAAVRRQLDVTWDMTDLSPERILNLLPTEFDGFKT